MEKYISLNAIVAEIKRRISEVSQLEKASYEVGLFDAYKNILSFLNTLEVKEVDLEEEIADIYEANYEEYLTYEEFADIAKYFFELGLNSQRKISYVLNIDDSLKELGIDPSSKEAKIFKESYCVALDKFLSQKGE